MLPLSFHEHYELTMVLWTVNPTTLLDEAALLHQFHSIVDLRVQY